MVLFKININSNFLNDKYAIFIYNYIIMFLFFLPGGWTLVSKFVVDDSSNADQLDYSYDGELKDLSKSTTENFLLKPSLYNTLISMMKITELRILCYKPWHGRTVDAVFNLKNQDVLNGVIGAQRSGYTNFCSSRKVRFLPDDTSLISEATCESVRNGRWGSIYNHFYYVSSHYHVVMFSHRMDCDDYSLTNDNYDLIGFWGFYVR